VTVARNEAGIQDIYPLSPMQQGMLFHTLYDPGSGAYVEQRTFLLRGPLDKGAFSRAWQLVVDRHGALRTTFTWEDLEQPLQLVHERATLAVDAQDWRGSSPEEQEARLARYLAEDRRRGFDLESAPLMRLALFRTDERTHRCVWTSHHLVIDGWCSPLVLAEAFGHYRALLRGRDIRPRPAPAFRDYIAWLQGRDRSRAESFWRETLRGFGVPTPLGIQSASATADYGQTGGLLPRTDLEALRAAARQRRLTLGTMIQGAWTLLLARYSDEADVVFGVTVAGRPPDLPEVESMVGCLINTLPLRVAVPRAGTLGAWLEELQLRQAAVRQFDYSSLVDIQGWSEVPRGVPLFESILVFYGRIGHLAGVADAARAAGLEVEDVRLWEQADYPLTVNIEPAADRLRARILYDRGKLDTAVAENMVGHLDTVLAAMAARLERSPADMPLLTNAERRHLLVDWNETQAPYPADRCLHHLVEDQVDRTPQATAAVAGDGSCSYAELDSRANQLAHHLRRIGVGPDVPVGILVERSLDLVVALLGTLKAGGAYLPLDVDLPAARIRQEMNSARAPVCLSQSRLLNRAPVDEATVLCLDRDWPAIAVEPATRPAVDVRPDNLVSIFYTSGSTGRPKGVANTHRGWVGRMVWMQQETPLGAGDTVLQKTTLTFDDSAVEFFWPLIAGGTIAFLAPGDHRDPRAIIDAAARHRAAAVHFVPSMLARVLDVFTPADRARLDGLRYVISSGEALRSDLVRRFRERLGTGPDSPHLYNQWGATEVSIDSTRHTCEPRDAADGAAVPVGRPLANHRAFILDRFQRPVPLGVAGEIHLGGIGLARGYYRDPGRTAEAFVPHPFAVGERVYRTGDRGYYRRDGAIMFLGRRDEQVKVRGNRVELAEIEAVLATHPAVRECGVVAVAGRDGHRLAAYYVSRTTSGGSRPDSPEALRAFLGDRLPEYMVPGRFVKLEQLPVTAGGKLDRRRLPDPGGGRPDLAQDYVPPSDPVETAICSVWQTVLGIDRVGVHDRFFDLGGHSLDATRAIARINREFSVGLPLRALFDAPTVAGLAGRVRAADTANDTGPGDTGPGAAAPPDRIPRLPRRETYELSHAQQRFWFQYRLAPFYRRGQTLNTYIEGPLDAAAFRQAFAAVVSRHGIMRTTYIEDEGGPRQRVHDGLEVPCAYRDLSPLGAEARTAALRQHFATEAATPLDLEREPSFRAALFRLEPETHLLSLTVHPIAYDGWSGQVLFQDLGEAYRAARRGREPELEPPLQYVDFADWQNRALAAGRLDGQRDYWLQQLAGHGAPPPLPADVSPADGLPAPMVPRVATVEPELGAGLRRLAADQGTTLYAVLLTCLAAWLALVSDRVDLTLCSPLSGRTHPDLEGVLGLLVNPVALRIDLAGNPTGLQALRRVTRTALEAQANQDYPFDLVIDALRRVHGDDRPLYTVVFVLQNAGNRAREVDGVAFRRRPGEARRAGLLTPADPVPAGDPTVNIELHLEAYEMGDELRLIAEYDPRRLLPDTVDRMLAQYREVLRRFVADPECRVSQLEGTLLGGMDDLFD